MGRVRVMTPGDRGKVLKLRPLRLGACPDYEPAFEELDEGGWLWVLEELSFVWREAQFEASLAYSHWHRMRDRTSYSIYRAAQDRADAAQDALSIRHAAEHTGEAVTVTRDLSTATRA
jgi:hypothetical protein